MAVLLYGYSKTTSTSICRYLHITFVCHRRIKLREMGDTPLRKRFRPRGPFSRAHGAVFVDESNHFSVGPCHPHLILLFDIDLRGLRIGVAHRHRDVGHGDALVVGQRGPGVARDIGAERLAEARLACHLAQQTVVATQGC